MLEVVEEIHYTGEVADGSTRVVLGGGRVGGQRIEETILLRIDAGLIAEMTLYVRPSRRRSRLAGAMIRPLAAAARSGEAVGTRLVWPR